MNYAKCAAIQPCSGCIKTNWRLHTLPYPQTSTSRPDPGKECLGYRRPRTNDIPIAAWTDFNIEHRNDLHQPIPCKIRLYHANANLILERTLEAMELLLGEESTELESDSTCNVIQFPISDKEETPSQ